MILPAGAVIDSEEEIQQTSRTYRLDLASGRIAGMIDELAAVEQTVYKILDTERFAYFIYSGNYGREARIGNRFALELEHWISEALLQDDRVTGINDFQSTVNGDEANVSFTVVSIFGAVPVERRI